MLRKIFNYFGYSVNKFKKSNDINDIIKLRLKNNPCSLLLDVGANKGDFTNNFIDEFQKILLFEPNKYLIKNLEERFEKENKIQIFNQGIDKINEIKKFYLTNDTGQTLGSIKEQTKLMQDNLKNSKIIDEIDVNFTRLDNFLNSSDQEKIFLKTDTQGNELEVLQSLGKYIKNTHFIKCEMPVMNLYKINYSFWDILEFLKKFNFAPVFFENGLRDIDGNLIEFDILFEKKI